MINVLLGLGALWVLWLLIGIVVGVFVGRFIEAGKGPGS